MSEQVNEPPVARYRFTLTIEGNTLYEVEDELVAMTRGGFTHDSHGYRRNQWHVIGSRTVRVMEHLNPDMTPERYSAELDLWFDARKAARAVLSGTRPVVQHTKGGQP